MANQQLQNLTSQSSAAATDQVPISDNASGQLKRIAVGDLLSAEGSLNLPASSELTIASGAITLTQSTHTVDTESDAASDDIDTINFPSGVSLAILQAENSARTVVFKHGTGNIKTPTASDWTLPDNGFALAWDDGSFVQIVAADVVSHNHAASEITSGTLTHERGGLEADVSAYSGLVKITGGATSAVTAPSGDVVGTSDSQTLTNKTLSGVTLADGTNVALNTTTGSQIGTSSSQKLALWGATPVTQPTALTATETTITHTAPGAADYAIAALTNSSPYGFASQDEGHTVLQVIANLQTRVDELETKLQALGAIA